MRKLLIVAAAAHLAASLFTTSSGQVVAGVDTLKISGWGGVEAGQIIHGWYRDPEELKHRWQERFDSRLSATAVINDRLSIKVGTEIAYQYSTTVAQTNGPSYLPGINMSLDCADLTYKLLRGTYPVTIQFGYFPFKYNAAVRNLGEYLFRSGCYPTFVTNNFDFPMNRLLGVNIENRLFENSDIVSLKQNLLFTSETELYPYQDGSLSWLATLSLWKKSLTMGGGVCGSRLFSVDPKNTTPHSPKSISEITNIRDAVDGNGIPIKIGDTTFYTFAGTKLMFNGTIDPKPLFHSAIFGAEDLKLYGEIAVLGLKNYKIFTDSSIRYDLLSERIPFMAGINLPTFRILDVLSFEMEYFKNRYFNSYYNEILGAGARLPLPYIQARGEQTGIDSSKVHYVKWSVYAKKSLGKNVQIVAQFARDHRHALINLSDPRYGDYGDNLNKPRDWYYLLKIAYGF